MQVDSVVETKPGLTRTRARVQTWAWVCALAPFAVLAILKAQSGLGLVEDDAGQYLMHARALAEGRPYGDTGYIFSPMARWIGPRLAPPGLPLVLAGIYKVFGANLIVMKSVMVLFAGAFLLLAGLYFARHAERRLGLAVAFLCGITPVIALDASKILTDLPFAALLWVVIVLMDAPPPMSARRIAGVTVAGGAALLFRTPGVALIPALLLFTLLRYRDHKLRPALPVALWIAAALPIALVADLGAVSVVSPDPSRLLRWLTMTHFGIDNIIAYIRVIPDSFLTPFPFSIANRIYRYVALALMVFGLGSWVWKERVRFLVCFAAMYVLLLLIAPAAQARYLWPLFPVFVFGLLNGVRLVALRFTPQPERATAVALAFALVLAPVTVFGILRQPRPVALLERPRVKEVVDYLTSQQRIAPLRVTFFKPRLLAWETGIPAMGPVISDRPNCMLAELQHRRITHVVAGSAVPRRANPKRPTIKRGFRELALSQASMFSPVMQNADYIVYRFSPAAAPPLAETEKACEVEKRS